ncbi:MAG: MFS transporter, partial [Proteobacteria bacterium]|nr:MFS transporter [Pseudomonadota bacterium]
VMVADAAPADRQGTAFGVLGLVNGAALILAGVMAGGLWDFLGPSATFGAAAALALIGVLATVVLPLGRHSRPQ